MESIPSDRYDWVVAFFLCCVLPEDLQDQAIAEFARILKPGGRFRLLRDEVFRRSPLEMAAGPFTPFIEKVYGARFDRQTLLHLQNNPNLKVTGTHYVKHDTYLIIDGAREK